MQGLRTTFDDRDQLRDYLREQFPDAAAVDDRLAPDVGGRRAALDRLDAIDPPRYAKTRNELDGAVTRLSPYLRHRVVTTAEVRDAALAKVNKPWESKKLVQEVAWHDFFQRVYAHVGHRGVWESLEPWKTGLGPGDYADELPPEIEAGETGVDWVDHFARQLSEEGWLHNHARMWLATYVVHARRVSWQAGARWFLRHLVDGDPASNNLSWQWVASTFGAKPYFMNRGNVIKNTGDRFPPHDDNDPLDGPYEAVADRIFPQGPDATQDAGEGLDINLKKSQPIDPPRGRVPEDAVAWVHGDMLSPEHPALRNDRPAVFVFDDAALRDVGVSLKPIAFVMECLAEIDGVTVLRSGDFDGDVAAAVRDFADGRPVVTGESPSPMVKATTSELDATVAAVKPFVELDGPVDLKRFSRYWRSAEKALKRAGHV